MTLYYDFFKGMKGIAQGASGSLSKTQIKSIKTRFTEADYFKSVNVWTLKRAGIMAMSFVPMKALNENKNQDYILASKYKKVSRRGRDSTSSLFVGWARAHLEPPLHNLVHLAKKIVFVGRKQFQFVCALPCCISGRLY